MKKKRIIPIAGMFAAVAVLAAPAAFAFAPTQVTIDGSKTVPGGDVDVTGVQETGTTLDFWTDISWTDMSCDSSEVEGYVKQGQDVTVGKKIGAITSLSFYDCAAVSGIYPVEVDGLFPVSGEWEIVVKETPAAAGDPVAIAIKDVSAHMHSTGPTPPTWPCELKATAAEVLGTFYPGTSSYDGKIVIDTPATADQYPLAIEALDGTDSDTSAPQTCGSIFDGEAASMEGTFVLTTDGVTPGIISHS